MRILSTIVAHPLRKISGATNAGLQLSESVARLAEIEVALMWDREEIAVAGELVIRHVRCWNRLGPLARLAPRFVRVPLYDSRIPEIIRQGNFDLVHIHNLVPTLAAERVARACQRRGVPYVISTHGFYELSRYAEINGFGRVKSALADIVISQPFQRIVAGAAGIFALSDREGEILARMGVDESRIDVVTNGVNEFYLEPAPVETMETVKAELGLGTDPILLFMGSLHAYKGVGVFLKSLKCLGKPFQAIVAGKFKDDSERRALLDNAGIDAEMSRKIVFTGAISDERLRALYHLADMFVYPTMGDTLPLVVLEAMACGLPIVSTTVGGIPFAVPPGCGILAPPGDPVAVAEAVSMLLQSPERMSAMGARARTRVLETFRWDASAERAVAGYRKVLANRMKENEHAEELHAV